MSLPATKLSAVKADMAAARWGDALLPVAWQPATSLATLPPSGFTPAQDLALVEQAAMGHTSTTHAKRQRLLVLLRAARNAAGDVAIDGQRALLDALRGRV